MPMVAWYMLSKESYMKRVIREVLPTGISLVVTVGEIVEDERLYRSVPLRRPACRLYVRTST